jgi:Tfp pilus assembly protein PilV
MKHGTHNMKHKLQIARSGEQGFSLVEILVASSILMVSLLSVIMVAGQALSISHRSVNTYVASTLLEEGAEVMRIRRDGAWTNISSLTAGTTYYPKFDTSTNTWSLTTTSSDGVVGIYTRSVVITAVTRDGSSNIASSGTADTGTKLVTVTVSWQENTGATISKSLQLYVSDIF